MKCCFTVRSLLLASMSFLLAVHAQTPVNLGTVEVSQLGHTFQTQSPPFPNLVTDYFIDQGQQSGGGSVLPQVTVDWNTNNVFVLTVSAPPGDMFLVDPSMLDSKFSGFLLWTNGLPGFSPRGTVTITLSNLQGAMPDFSQSISVLNYSQGAFGFDTIDSAPFFKEIAFTSMVITGTAVPQTGGEGALTFTPDVTSSLAFISATSKSNDPGPYVSIIPFNYRAQNPLELTSTLTVTNDAAGNFAVTFTGALQSSSNPGGPWTDVVGHPLDAFAVPKGSQNAQQFFRSRYTH